MTGERKNHAPVAALKIRLPSPAAFSLKKFCVVFTETAQVGVTRYHDNVFRLNLLARAGPYDSADQLPVSRLIGLWFLRIKAGVFKELECRASDYKTMQRILGRRVATVSRPFTVRVKAVLPN